MISLGALTELDQLGYDTLIDVRSPAEFAEDHVPGAINLPVLNNEERARVGTVYKQDSPFMGRKLGAALVFRNAADHIEQRLSHHEGNWRPLVYCWRGGQRSGAFAWMLREIGWRSETLQGGYKSYRRLVVKALYEGPLPHRLIRLCGYTGTAKTALLQRLPDHGVQVVDLEALARHRGSLLGEVAGGQPSQKAFESGLAMALARLDLARPVVVEAESSKIGLRSLPPALWTAMCAAPLISVEAPIEARARYLAGAYRDILADKARLRDKLDVLRRHQGHAVVDHWMALIDEGDDVALCHALARDHYDPAYDRATRRFSDLIRGRVAAVDLGSAALDQIAADIARMVQSMEM